MGARESNPAGRGMDAALRHAMRTRGELAGGARSGACDAELAAAYVEGQLARGERERFEAHMADCAACRSLATALADELAPEAAQPAGAPGAATRRWWDWRWAVPAMAGVVLVASAVYYQREQVFERRAAQAPSVETAAARSGPAQVAAARPPSEVTEPAMPAAQPLLQGKKQEQEDEEAAAAAGGESGRFDRQVAGGTGGPLRATRKPEMPAPARAEPAPTIAGQTTQPATGSPEDQNAVSFRAKALGGLAGPATHSPNVPATPPPTRGTGAPAAGNATIVTEAKQGAVSEASKEKADALRGDERSKAAAKKGAARPGDQAAGLGAASELSKDQRTAQRDSEQPKAASAQFIGRPADAAVAGNRFRGSIALPGGAPLRNLLEHDGRLWAVSDGGRIFRSTDGGRTWSRIESPTTADLVSVQWDAQGGRLLVTDRQGKEYGVKP